MGIEGTITGDDWAELVKKQGGKCPYCDGGRYLVIDHIIPLSRGGTNTKDNIQAICVQCNSSKGNKLPEEWPGRKLPPGDY
jgi:5-methylcytosine-specific restriction endonuclease McrA